MKPATLLISNIAWDFVWQRHQTIARLLARDGLVLFCEVPGVRRVGVRDFGRLWRRWRVMRGRRPAAAPPDGVRILRPWLLPATNRVFCAINGRLLRRFVAHEPALRDGVDLIWNYPATRSALQLIERVPHQRLVYDCTDDWLAIRGIPRFLAADEEALLRRSDLTLVPSRVLAERKAPMARRLEYVPHGAWVERFLMEPRGTSSPLSLRLLYYGHIHHQHLDIPALERLAVARPRWRLVLIGPVHTRVRFPDNVELVGQQLHERLREWISEADVLLLPYALNRYTEAVMPAKTYECLATGRPVVATPLPELVRDLAPLLQLVAPGADWAEAVESAWRADSPETRSARVGAAQANSWEARFRVIRSLLHSLA